MYDYLLCRSQDIDFVFSPTVKELHPENLDYLARYSIKTTNYDTNSILKMNYSIRVSAFRLQSFVSYILIFCT